MTARAPYLIIGNGQIGSALADKLGGDAAQVTRDALDLATATDADYRALLEKHQPSIVINAAAYTAVDKAESERELAMQINGNAPGLLANACAEQNTLLIHYSTDYVFDGTGKTPWTESDAPSPINYYGETKLAGERAIEASGAAHLIFRVSWLYAKEGCNFVNTMLKLGTERESLSIVVDQIGAPCYAEDIADATIEIAKQYLGKPDGLASGVYHMCNGGETSWYDFALEIWDHANRYESMLVRNVKAIPTAEYPTPAARPRNSRMNCNKLRHTFDVSLPHWKGSLLRFMEKKYAN